MHAAIAIANRIVALCQRAALVAARLEAVQKAAKGMHHITGDGDGDGIPYESRNRHHGARASAVPPPPKFITSDAKVKAENEMHAAKLHELASKGDLAGLKAYSAFSAKSQKLVAYKTSLVASLEPKAKPAAAPAPPPAPKAPEPPKSAVGAWKPAGTLAEAEAQMAGLGVSLVKGGQQAGPFKMSGKPMADKVFLGILNRAGPELTRLHQIHPGIANGVKLVQQYPSSKANGTYNLIFKAISLQPADKIVSNSGWKSKFGLAFSTSSGGGGFEATLRHELGHHIDYATKKQFREELKAQPFQIDGKAVDTAKWARANVSEYAGTNTSEALAEMFAKYTAPDYKVGSLPSNVEAIMLKIAKRGK